MHDGSEIHVPHRIAGRRSQTRWSCTVELCLTIAKYEFGVSRKRSYSVFVFGRPRQPPQRLHTEVHPLPHVWWVTRGPLHAIRSTAILTRHHTTGRDRQQTAATAAPDTHDTPNICRNQHVRLLSTQTASRPPSAGYRNVLVENSAHFVYDAESRDEQVPTFRNNYCLHLHGSIIL